MGEIIGVWSTYPRTGRTTITNAIAYKLLEKIDVNKKVLICCANSSNGTLLKSQGISSEEVGIEDLVTYKLVGLSINYNSVIARRGRLFLIGTSKITQYFAKNYLNLFKELIEDLKSEFDFIIIDLPDGKNNLLGNMLIEKCGKIFIVADQDIDSLTGYKSISLTNYAAEPILIINKYRKVYPNKSEIKDILNFKNIFYPPDCDILMKMRNKGKLIDYFTIPTEFNNEIENLVSQHFGINFSSLEERKSLQPGYKSLFTRFKMSMQGGDHS